MRFIVSVLSLLTRHFQTELVINTHAVVSELEQNVTSTHTMVTDIHRTMVKGQEGSDGKNLLVSGTRILFIAECDRSPLPSRPKPGQQPEPPTGPLSYIFF